MTRYATPLLLLGLGIPLVYVLQRGYPYYLNSYLDYLGMPEYSYLFVLTPLSVVLAAHLIINGFAPSRPSLTTLVALLSLFLGSLLFYTLGGFSDTNSAQLYGVSFVFLGLSFLLMMLKPLTVRHFIGVLLLLLATVPVPLSLISYSSTSFSYLIGRFVALIMGAEVIETGSGFFLSVYDAGGTKRVFELVHACSGIVSIASILAITPLIVYAVMQSRGSLKARAAKAAAIVAAAVGIVFVGNAARVAAVLYFTQHDSYERALEIFHQYPSLLYSALAVGAAFFLMGKLAPPAPGRGRRFPLPTGLSARGRRVAAVALTAVALVAFGLASLAPALAIAPARAGPQSLPTLDTLLNSPAKVVFNGTGADVLGERPVPALIAALGSSSVNLIVLRYNGSTYAGYIEIAESPARFHGWHVCLTLQGYTILREWRESSGDLLINYLLISRGGEKRLLGYTVYSLPFLLGNGTATAYVRVSLFVDVGGGVGVEEGAASIRQMLELPLAAEGGGSGALERVLLIRNVLLAANAVVFSAFVIDGLSRALKLAR